MHQIRSIGSYERFIPYLCIIGGAFVILAAVASDLLRISLEGVGPNQMALALAGAVLLLTGLALTSSSGFRQIGHWLLVVTGIIVVSIAADVLVVGGLPAFTLKQLMLVTIVFGLALINYGTAQGEWRHHLGDVIEFLVVHREQALQLVGITVQLVLIVMVMHQYHLENQTVYSNMMFLTLYGFLVHFFLPAGYRLPFFFLLSAAAILGILGISNGLWLLLMGTGLVGLTYLPISIRARLGLMLATGLALMLLRSGRVASPVPSAVWPILGSMFMFRMIIYFYDLAHSKEKASPLQSLSYFFLLPNVVFPFFPIVDFTVFRRTYYNAERFQIYQRGVQLIFYGITQLIIYRFVNRYLMLAPQDVTNASQLVRFVLSSYLLYVRVTGQFHIIIGILHLFGFNLPKVNHLNFMATSFTDLWRRANIYWKEFMQKVVFYQVQYRVRKQGLQTSVLVATGIVIVVTWFLHSYQWFWLRGSFLITAQDMSFWSLIGIWLVTNVLWESRRGRKRSLKAESSRSLHTILGLGVRSASVTAFISILWSYWFSNSIPEWASLWTVGVNSLGGILFLLLAFLALVVVYAVAHAVILHASPIWTAYADPARTKFRPMVLNGGLLLGLFLLGNPAVHERAGGAFSQVLGDLTEARLSAREETMLQRGYYENLMGVQSFNSELWELYVKRPTDWPLLQETRLARVTGEFRLIELVPSQQLMFHGAFFSTNRWGMRDQEYEKLPSPGAYRVALLGPSYVMGAGVADDETFEALVERRLNEEHGSGEGRTYEILNFGVAGYSVLQHLSLLEDRALAFQPNALLLVAHQTEEDTAVRNLAGAAIRGTAIPYDYLRTVIDEAGVELGMTQVEAERRLKPYEREIIRWAYGEIIRLAEEREMLAMWAFVPTPEDFSTEKIDALSRSAEDAGFIVFNLAGAYGDHNLDSLAVAKWDKHPNAEGHRLLADALYEALTKTDSIIDPR